MQNMQKMQTREGLSKNDLPADHFVVIFSAAHGYAKICLLLLTDQSDWSSGRVTASRLGPLRLALQHGTQELDGPVSATFRLGLRTTNGTTDTLPASLAAALADAKICLLLLELDVIKYLAGERGASESLY